MIYWLPPSTMPLPPALLPTLPPPLPPALLPTLPPPLPPPLVPPPTFAAWSSLRAAASSAFNDRAVLWWSAMLSLAAKSSATSNCACALARCASTCDGASRSLHPAMPASGHGSYKAEHRRLCGPNDSLGCSSRHRGHSIGYFLHCMSQWWLISPALTDMPQYKHPVRKPSDAEAAKLVISGAGYERWWPAAENSTLLCGEYPKEPR